MPIRAILFDKDGTLVDFQRTWGPATHTVMTKLCNGDAVAFERLAAVSLYDPARRRLLAGGDRDNLWIRQIVGAGARRSADARIRRANRRVVFPGNARSSDTHG